MNRLGYTLLEVILASMLAAVVLLIIATSIEIQFRAFNAGRSHVEEAQLARVLLHRIGDDLQAIMPPGNEAGSTVDNASKEDSPGGSKGNDADSVSELTDDESGEFDDESALDESTLGGPAPGLYGELDWLRFDVVRAKRRAGSSSDELTSDAAMPRAAMPGAADEIETIVYYVLTPEELAAEAISTNSDQTGGGLVRRELVRPTSAWAAETGLLEYHDTAVPPIAPEVTAIEFRYHDGVAWLESWDSSTSGALPKAVEIRLFFARQTPANTNISEAVGGFSDEEDDLPDVQYRLIVPIMIQGEITRGGSAGDGSAGDGSAGGESESLDESSESSASSDDSGSSGGER